MSKNSGFGTLRPFSDQQSIMESPPVEVVAECAVKIAKLKWIIKNFSSIKGQKGTEVRSPEYQIDIAGDRTKWKLELYPYGNRVEGEVAVFLRLVDTKLDDLVVQYELALLNMQGKPIKENNWGLRPYSKGSSWGVDPIISRADLTLISDNLTIIATVKVSNSASMIVQSSIINNLVQDADYSDVLITVCGSEFKAHKAILAARSSVFSSMFKNNMKEATSGKIEIEDMTPKVFEEFLKFIYTGIANVKEYASELLAAADKYHFRDLKAFCEEGLEKNINEENCLKTLVLSDLHSSKPLKESAMRFIASNTQKFDKNKLAEIKNPSLMLEIIEELMNHKK